MVRQNELAVASLSSEYQKNIEQALTDVKTNMERISNTEGQIEEARAAEVLAASRYKNGVGTNLEITNASTNVQRALLTRLQYQYQLCLAKVQLAELMGYKYWLSEGRKKRGGLKKEKVLILLRTFQFFCTILNQHFHGHQ